MPKREKYIKIKKKKGRNKKKKQQPKPEDQPKLQRAETQLTPVVTADDVEKRRWISHMVLGVDGVTDPPGIKLRAIETIHGIMYLDPGAITNALSYVFGPLVETLWVIHFLLILIFLSILFSNIISLFFSFIFFGMNLFHFWEFFYLHFMMDVKMSKINY